MEDQYQTEIVRQTRVTCFHIQVGNCAKCGKRIQGRDSRQTSDALGAAASQVGPEALSLATILNKELGIPLGKTTAVLDKAFGLTLTPGGLSQALARLGKKCEPTYQDLISQVRMGPSVTMDESGWKVGGHPWWLWVAVTGWDVSSANTFRRHIQLLKPEDTATMQKEMASPASVFA